MADLSARDFADYFQAVHGHRPFPWQARLLERVAETGRWPELLDLPTGSGKTAAIDVAVFHLALEAERPAAERRAPMRIVLVVDRRTVVDQAFERAKLIAAKLRAAKDGVLGIVRERLCSLSGGEHPLAHAQLRGGIPRDNTWAKAPDQPLVAISTVDQVGSRLLFRGYGVSPTMRPIQAGLLANDTLILLDEVHLSNSFLETLAAIRRYRGWTTALPDRWQFVPMSATAQHEGERFGLSGDDRACEALAQRLGASKPVDCVEVKVSGGDDTRRSRFADEIATRTLPLAMPGRTVGVVVNRIATALEVYKRVSERLGHDNVHLVTGRMRPLDRDELDRRLVERVGSGRSRHPSAPPVVVVSTQCIEAGADFDFDSLVTECASIDALRQRFGRLNRLGTISDATGVVFVRSDALGKEPWDPVYGASLARTWEWLTEGPRDFGIDVMGAALENERERLTTMFPERPRAPVMLPAHLDAWVQTTPTPRPDPDISFWLHGVDQRADADVQIIWRADVSEEEIGRAAASKHEEGRDAGAAFDALLARIEACPPTGLEALAVPVGAARAWLVGLRSGKPGSTAFRVSDADAATSRDEEEAEESGAGSVALAWRGDESVLVGPAQLEPGMTLIVPSAYGGLACGTWDPSSREPVDDLGEKGRWEQTRRPIVRLHPMVRGASQTADAGELPRPIADEDPEDALARIETWVATARSREPAGWFGDVLEQVAKELRRSSIVRVDRIVVDDDEVRTPEFFVVVGRVSTTDATDISTEDDASSSYTGIEVPLHDHMKGVRTHAGMFALRCGLPEAIVRDVELAARWHDAGKADPRFQRWLRGGSPLADVASELLAKSRIDMSDRRVRTRARERSGYPPGARHELSSITLMETESTILAGAVDRELVLHLIASHHGWCRPFAPVVDDPEPVEMTLLMGDRSVSVTSNHGLGALESGVAERFWQLVERYGWFGLAWLEAILRLADHRRSALERSRGFREDVDEEAGS